MAGSDQTAKVTLIAVTAPYTKGMGDASRATDKLGRDIDQTGDKAKGFGTKVNAAKVALTGLAVAGAAVAGTALVKFLSDSVAAAGDLEQSVGGVDAVFKDSADSIHAFGQNSAEAVGLSRNEFNELATVTGALLKNSGIEDFSQATLDLTARAADVSATFGGTAKDAVEAFNAALRGESDPIERYGIKINEAAIKAKVLEMGLGDLTGAQAEQAKVQARIQIIMDQSADSAGRFADEASTLQGQQQRLNAEWENAQASLGEALLPAMTAAVEMMRDGVEVGLAIADAFAAVPEPVWLAAAALGAVHVLGGPLGRFGTGVSTTMRAAGDALGYARLSAEKAGGGFAGAKAGLQTFTGQANLAKGAANGLKAAGSGLMGVLGGPWGLAITGAAVLVGKWIQNNREAEAAIKSHTDAIVANEGALSDQNRELVKTELLASGAYEAAKDMGISIKDLTDAALGNEAAQKRVNDALDTHQAKLYENETAQDRATSAWTSGTDAQIAGENAITKVKDALIGQSGQVDEAIGRAQLLAEADGELAFAGEDAAIAMDSLGLGIEDAGSAAEGAEGPTDEYAAAQEELAEKAERTKEIHDELIESLLSMVDAAYGARDAERDYEAALDDMTASLEKNKDAHGNATEAGRENEATLDAVGLAALTAAERNLENGKSINQVQDDVKGAREDFIAFATQMGYSSEKANALADDLGLTRTYVNNLADSIEAVPDKTVRIDALTGDAESAVDRVKFKIANLAGKTVYVNVISNYTSRGQMPANSRYSVGLADGGQVPGPWQGPRADNVMGISSAGMPTARVNPKEWVQPVASVDYYGAEFMRAIQHRAIPRHLVRFADGGPVGYAPAAQATGGGGIDGAALAAPIAAAVGAEMSKYRIISFDGRELGRLVESGRRGGSYV